MILRILAMMSMMIGTAALGAPTPLDDLLREVPDGFYQGQSSSMQIKIIGRRLYISGVIDATLMDAIGLPGQPDYYRNGRWTSEKTGPNPPHINLGEIDEVVLNSPGGVVSYAFNMGQFLRMWKGRKIKTTLLPTTRCASACTMIFLSGEERRMTEDSTLMFHAMTDEKGCWKKYREFLNTAESDRTSAKFGSCLASLNGFADEQEITDILFKSLYSDGRLKEHRQGKDSYPARVELITRISGDPKQTYEFDCKLAKDTYAMVDVCTDSWQEMRDAQPSAAHSGAQ